MGAAQNGAGGRGLPADFPQPGQAAWGSGAPQSQNVKPQAPDGQEIPVGAGSTRRKKVVLGGGLEPPQVTPYAPQTYASTIPPSAHSLLTARVIINKYF